MKLMILVTLALFGVALGNGSSQEILKQVSDINADGSFQWGYETKDTISNAHGHIKELDEPALVIDGDFTYTADDGSVISTQYVADENGYRAVGAHLPTPHPLPALIRRSLEYQASLQSQ